MLKEQEEVLLRFKAFLDNTFIDRPKLRSDYSRGYFTALVRIKELFEDIMDEIYNIQRNQHLKN